MACNEPMILQQTHAVILPKSLCNSSALFLRKSNAPMVIIHALLPVKVACIFGLSAYHIPHTEVR